MKRLKGTVLFVQDVLKQKHPEAKPINPTAVVATDHIRQELHPVIFDETTGPLIRSSALRTEGSAGPSGMKLRGGDPYVPLSVRIYQNFVMPSPACVNGYLPPAYVNQNALSAFTACRLIALNKCPGIRSIGVGEMARHIL